MPYLVCAKNLPCSNSASGILRDSISPCYAVTNFLLKFLSIVLTFFFFLKRIKLFWTCIVFYFPEYHLIFRGKRFEMTSTSKIYYSQWGRSFQWSRIKICIHLEFNNFFETSRGNDSVMLLCKNAKIHIFKNANSC